MPRVGHVWIGAPRTDEGTAGMLQGFKDKGYALGRNLVLEERYARGHAQRLPPAILGSWCLITPRGMSRPMLKKEERRCSP